MVRKPHPESLFTSKCASKAFSGSIPVVDTAISKSGTLRFFHRKWRKRREQKYWAARREAGGHNTDYFTDRWASPLPQTFDALDRLAKKRFHRNAGRANRRRLWLFRDHGLPSVRWTNSGVP